ncbi:PfkB family carbohydrate kinase [Enterobacter sp.]|uniref:PfkB family carbohydrate kinase n=1 Tax=Enterobacter sp. TaxID=42895 RepID=UPI00296ECE13|nr:PfkB family carbohydrate kinase [Enterobacter sp.]
MKSGDMSVLLNGLNATRPVTVLGAAVIDVITEASTLPFRGCDLELKQRSVNIGGCALNIAVTLHRLGIRAQNALPVGVGVWADMITTALAQRGIKSVIKTDTGDNGWCIALVEPDGERTFMSFSGVERGWCDAWLNQLHVPPGSLISLSGYQLAAPCGELLVTWLETLSDVTPFIDFGPRIEDIPAPLMTRILRLKPIITLNRAEAEIAAQLLEVEVDNLGPSWQAQIGAPLIVRHDIDGAWFYDGDEQGYVAAFPATVVDTIGAGDSHAGGVLAGLASGFRLADAIKLGNAVAAMVVSQRGGDCAPTLDALRLAYKDV